MANNPRIYQDILETVTASMAPCIRTSDRRNARYTADDFSRCMIRASVSNGQIAGCTMSERAIRGEQCSRPTDEWIRITGAKSDPNDILDSFAGMVRKQLGQFLKLGIPKDSQRLVVAIDMHLIPRYDKKHGAELVGSKHKSGTSLFERYITVQCVMQNRRLVLGVLPMPALEDSADFVRRIINTAHMAGAGIAMAMLDRGSFAADVIAELDAAGIGYLVPCRNTFAVVASLNEHMAGMRGKVSESAVSDGSISVPYTMLITERKSRSRKREDLPPHEKYIGFATNRPDTDPDEYRNRWGTGTGYRMIQNARVKTHSKNPAVRLLCFMYSAAVLNAWVMANAVLAHMTGICSKNPIVTQQHLKQMILEHHIFDPHVPPQPPPPAFP